MCRILEEASIQQSGGAGVGGGGGGGADTDSVERQRHEDGLVARLGRVQPELGAAVVDEVELHVAPAPHQLPLPLVVPVPVVFVLLYCD